LQPRLLRPLPILRPTQPYFLDFWLVLLLLDVREVTGDMAMEATEVTEVTEDMEVMVVTEVAGVVRVVDTDGADKNLQNKKKTTTTK
jgi:hypothetical protein